MKLLSWNIRNGGGKRRSRQLDEIADLGADLVALQEVTAASVTGFRTGLQEASLPYAIDSFSLAPSLKPLTGPRKYGQLLASRWPLTAISPTEFDLPWRERVLSAFVDVPTQGPIEVHVTGIPPGSSNGWTKIEQLEGIWKRLARPSSIPRILAGDFNTPKSEGHDGTVETWDDRDERWKAGERRVIVDLADHDLADTFRALNGYSVEAFSHYVQRVGRRYDHIFASKRLNPISAKYLDRLRSEGLSDHAPLLVEFNPVESPRVAG
jgi:endonuclease/exonuclease/phosphatase family metal-dependent hydrolase